MIDERFFDEEFDELISKHDPTITLVDDVREFDEQEERMMNSIGLGGL